jgi:hypothetical protein
MTHIVLQLSLQYSFSRISLIAYPLFDCYTLSEELREADCCFFFPSSGFQGVLLRGAYYFCLFWVDSSVSDSVVVEKVARLGTCLSCMPVEFPIDLYMQVSLNFTKFYNDTVLTCCRIMFWTPRSFGSWSCTFYLQDYNSQGMNTNFASFCCVLCSWVQSCVCASVRVISRPIH